MAELTKGNMPQRLPDFECVRVNPQSVLENTKATEIASLMTHLAAQGQIPHTGLLLPASYPAFHLKHENKILSSKVT